MTVYDFVSLLNEDDKVKIGATEGFGYVHAGNVKDVLKEIRGWCGIGQKEVYESWEADSAADPDCTIIMYRGNDKGRFWLTEEAICKRITT